MDKIQSLFNVKAGSMYSNHYALKGWYTLCSTHINLSLFNKAFMSMLFASHTRGAIFEKLMTAQLTRKFRLLWNMKFVAVFTRAHHSLSHNYVFQHYTSKENKWVPIDMVSYLEIVLVIILQ
jgi:hypothetical protein